ncbi:MAG: NADH-quinone oxidoreductase subunit N [Bacteroidota bacterium]
MNETAISMIQELANSMALFKAETTLVIAFVTAIIADLIFKKSRHIAGIIAIIGFVVCGYFLIGQSGQNEPVFSMMLTVDPFADFFKWLILLSSLVVVLMSFLSKELNDGGRSMGEYYTLILGMAVGMFLLAGATNLIMIYLAIETMSLSSYVLTGYTKEVKRASEASLKYVIFGSLASGIMIYGISIIFGLTGSLNLYEINAFINAEGLSNLAVITSGIMILVGIAYKISAVPFHFWTPDVYEGAPIPITAYLSIASKAAGFAVLIRFLKITYIDPALSAEEVWTLNIFGGLDWPELIGILSVITMTFGNLVALWQTNAKRMLAYSSIAHAGYMLMGVAVMTDAGILGVLVYFLTYLIMNLGAFYVILLIANKTGSEELDDYTGLGYRAPALGVAMTIFLVSLTGLPPTVGFIGKFFLFAAVIDAGWIWLAVIGVLNSVVALFYYVKIFRNMWVRGVEASDEKLSYSPAAQVLLYALAIPALYFGIFYSPIVAWAENSVKIFFGM